MTSRLALDGGQSGCRARDAAGHIWEGVGIDTARPRIPQLAAAVRAAAPEGTERVLVGTTGRGVEDTAAALLDAEPGRADQHPLRTLRRCCPYCGRQLGDPGPRGVDADPFPDVSRRVPCPAPGMSAVEGYP